MPDSTPVSNRAEIVADVLPPEEFTANNSDDSQVVVFRSDVRVTKSVVDVPTTNEFFTEAGNTLEYTIEYENAGTIEAEDVVISEILPPDTR